MFFKHSLNRYFIIYKPYQVLSQFSLPAGEPANSIKQTLKNLFEVPTDVYPVGRLDYDSEGLLVLTNDSRLNHQLLHPSFAHEREYWVQVEGLIHEQAIRQLGNEMSIQVHGKEHRTKKAIVERFETEPPVPPRIPPIRFRKNIPVSWIRMVLTEGKHHQVRKMTARAGFPTLRLLRYRIEGVTLEGMQPGDMREMEAAVIEQQLFGTRR